MIKKKMIFDYPASLVEEPVTYKLVKDYDLSVNILRAKVQPRESGRMVVELKGDPDMMEQAFEYLRDQGMTLNPLVQQMRHIPERCVQCTACTAICPTGALSADPDTRELVFDASKCIMCEACIPVCAYAAVESQF